VFTFGRQLRSILNYTVTMSVRYITYSDDTSSNHVILETDNYDIELNDVKFQMMKEYLSMSDNEILNACNEIVNILDDLTIILLNADCFLDNHNVENISFDSDIIHKDILSGCKKLKKILEFMFNKIKANSAQYNSISKPEYDSFQNEAIIQLSEICYYMVESFETYPIHVVSCYLTIVKKNIIEDERDRLMMHQIVEGSKRNENIIVIESSAKETFTSVFIYVSKNNEKKFARLKIKRKKYLINIKNNTCTCPNFYVGHMKYGTCCKHLMEIRNKSYCLLMMNKVMASLSQNSYNNYHVPFKEMLHLVYDKSINYNPYNS